MLTDYPNAIASVPLVARCKPPRTHIPYFLAIDQRWRRSRRQLWTLHTYSRLRLDREQDLASQTQAQRYARRRTELARLLRGQPQPQMLDHPLSPGQFSLP